MSVAKRVSEEVGCRIGEEVSSHAVVHAQRVSACCVCSTGCKNQICTCDTDATPYAIYGSPVYSLKEVQHGVCVYAIQRRRQLGTCSSKMFI